MTSKPTTIEQMIEEGKLIFARTFKVPAEVVSIAPGAVNILGEHTEYTDGYVFTMAIPLVTVFVGRKSSSRTIRLHTISQVDAPLTTEFFAPLTANPLDRGTPLWANYIKGIIQYFKGPKVGFDAVILSNIPMRRGLSSSASLEAAAYTFLETVTGMKAETKSVTSVHIPLDSITFLVVDYHNNQEYPARLLQDKKVILNRVIKMCNKTSLRDCSMEEINNLNLDGCIDNTIYKNCRFVIMENERVLKAVDALTHNNYEQFGCLMSESHDALKDDYGIMTTNEQDNLIKIIRETAGVLGVKVISGGYGGSLLTLVKAAQVDEIIRKVKHKYFKEIDFYQLKPAGGPVSLTL